MVYALRVRAARIYFLNGIYLWGDDCLPQQKAAVTRLREDRREEEGDYYMHWLFCWNEFSKPYLTHWFGQEFHTIDVYSWREV